MEEMRAIRLKKDLFLVADKLLELLWLFCLKSGNKLASHGKTDCVCSTTVGHMRSRLILEQLSVQSLVSKPRMLDK